MAHSNHNPEVKQPKKTVTRSVEDLIGKKKAEKEARVSESTSAKMHDTKEEVETIVGMEKPSDKISEKTGEKGERKGGGVAASDLSVGDGQMGEFSMEDYTFPSEEIMIKKIRTAISAQIEEEWKRAAKLQGHMIDGGAYSYAKTISKIRTLKQVLASLFTSAAGFLKEMYVKYFLPDGKRRRVEDIS